MSKNKTILTESVDLQARWLWCQKVAAEFELQGKKGIYGKGFVQKKGILVCQY